VSTGKACEMLATTPGSIERAAVASSIEPRLRLNGVSYWGNDQLSVLRQALAQPAARRSRKPRPGGPVRLVPEDNSRANPPRVG
jgi:hypothetical protein